MLFEETFTTFLPCNEKVVIPEFLKELPAHNMIKRNESNGVVVLVDPFTRKVYFESINQNVFPLDIPVHVDFELTQDCNLKCGHCFVTDRTQSFSDKTMKVIEKLVEEGIIIFELIGGEPFLVKNIFGIIDYLKKNNKIVTISTNGTLITKQVARKLARNPPSRIYVSLDGPRRIHDLIRGIGGFDKAVEGIKNLNEVGILPTISFCINKLNLPELNEFIEEIKNLKINSLFFIFGEQTDKPNSFHHYFFQHPDRAKIAEEISKIKFPIRYSAHFNPRQVNTLYYGCFFRLTMCEITPAGDVLSCPIIRKKQGNVLEEDLKIIWKRMQEDLVKNKPVKCNACGYKERCFPCEFDCG